MPMLNISMRAGKPEAYRLAIMNCLYLAMREALSVPADDQFMILTEHEPANIRIGSAYGIARTSDVVYIQITVFNSRTPEQKIEFYRRTVELLGTSPGIRPGDVFIVMHDAPKENWSVGNGLAQFV